MRRSSFIFTCLPAAALLILAACAGDASGGRMMPDGRRASASSPASVAESVIHSFAGSDGSVPQAGLVNVHGVLYGTTSYGGTGTGSLCDPGGCGTVYRVTTDGAESVVFSFSGRNGADPEASLLEVKGKLYGTTVAGGTFDHGEVFSVTKSGNETMLHDFRGAPDGDSPSSGLVDVKGKLYGTTYFGGAYDNGTVFSVTRSGAEKVVYSFRGASYGDGENPQAGLTEVGGDLYGTTFRGGSGAGTVFKVTTSGNERVIYRFAPYGHDGTGPGSTLVNVNGRLYGTTWFGGSDRNRGAVYSVTTSGRERVLHGFKGVPDGDTPFGGLVNVNGTLYGTTWVGGLSIGEGNEGLGTVFSIEPSGKESVIYRFGGAPDAALVPANLVEVNGALFGASASGGTYPYTSCPGGSYAFGCGAVFKLSLSK